jgi:hypothetical protein
MVVDRLCREWCECYGGSSRYSEYFHSLTPSTGMLAAARSLPVAFRNDEIDAE